MNEKQLNKYMKIIDELSLKYNYKDNIKHLLYIILPAFILKYGNENEQIILDCFTNIPIIITGKEDDNVQAMYVSYPYLENGIKIRRGILLNRYNNIPFIQLVDNLIHEFNHALNSYCNGIIIKDDVFYLRTGLSKVIYDKYTFKILSKDKASILEEIINSKQTESIINIIRLFNIDINIQLQNTVYALKSSTNDDYISNSYYIFKSVCKKLLNNKTFLLTLEKLRINGNIDDIEIWFNDIYGNSLGYNCLVNSLYDLYQLKDKKVMFKKSKVRNLIMKLTNICDTFDNNCNLK